MWADMDYNAVLHVNNYLEYNLDDNHTGNSSFQSTSSTSQVCYGVSTGVRKQTFSSFCTIL